MLLNEILNTPSKTRWVYKGKYEAVATFVSRTDMNERVYYVLFHANTGPHEDSWNVIFGDKNHQTGELNLINNTNDFNSTGVFSTLKNIIDEFIQMQHPKHFTFTADNKRTNLYIKLFTRFLPNSRIEKENNQYIVNLG